MLEMEYEDEKHARLYRFQAHAYSASRIVEATQEEQPMSLQHILSFLILLIIILLIGLVTASVVRADTYYDDYGYEPYDPYGYYEPTRIVGPTDGPPMTIIPGDGHEPSRIIGPVDSPPMTIIPGSHGHSWGRYRR